MLPTASAEMPVRLTNVSKRFDLNRTTHRTFMETFTRPFKRREPSESFWPLRDVSFELRRGTTLGIIGENGAGKSTILKLIARILEPTGGEVVVNGRVSALLELGASFHPELTGRENIFLAASIAGIGRRDIQQELADIVDFADIGPYIDMPVKHYSSGMYVRLGFAVATHLRPEILLVDEVLAVGDELFQHKSFQSFKRLQRSGVTILLVSHSMDQITEMCDTALWLHEGYVRSFGATRRVIADYLALSAAQEQANQVAEWAGEAIQEADTRAEQRDPRGAPSADARRWGDGAIEISDVRLLDRDERPASTFTPEDPIRIEFDYRIKQRPVKYPAFGIAIYRSDDIWCYGTNTAIEKLRLTDGPLPERGTVAVELPMLQLLQGDYTVDVAVHDPSGEEMHDYIREAGRFYVKNPKNDQGFFRPKLRWSLLMAQKRIAP